MMMRGFAVFIVIGILLLLSLAPALAQPITLAEDDYWSRLAQTDALLNIAVNQAQAERTETLAQIRGLWDGVYAVQVGENVINLDARWLQNVSETSDLFLLQQRVRALLDYRAQQIAAQGGVSSSALDDVLRDPRFRYSDATPEPRPPGPRMPDVNVPGQLSQIILIALGVIGVVLALLYVARNLRVQRSALETADETHEDPTTSVTATERAAELESSRDYRTAIRYLYLSSLLMLDERGFIRYDRTLTNREHLRQIADKPRLLELLRPVVNIFDEVWYGFLPVDEDFYQNYRRQVEQLRRIVHDGSR
jgi:hypothetical protein